MQVKTKIVSCHTADSEPVNQEVNGTVILPPLVVTICHYAECRYAKCCDLFIVMLNVVMLSVIMLSAVAPSKEEFYLDIV